MSRRFQTIRQQLKRYGLLPAVPVTFLLPSDLFTTSYKTSSSNTLGTGGGSIGADLTSDTFTVPATGTYEIVVRMVVYGRVGSTRGAGTTGTSRLIADLHENDNSGGFGQVKGDWLLYDVTAGNAGGTEDVRAPVVVDYRRAATNGHTYQYQCVTSQTNSGLAAVAGAGDADNTAGIKRLHSLWCEMRRTA